MKKYSITLGLGLNFKIEVEEWENESDALDKLIDELENEGCEMFFISDEDIDNYCDDEYICGGNHGRNLLHNGYLHIEILDYNI